MQFVVIICTKSMNILVDNDSLSTNIIQSYGYRNHQLFPVNDDFQNHVKQRRLFFPGTQHLIFLLFEDKGRLHAH